MNETVKKCYKPIEKVCNGQGPEECRTVYESSCTTKYVEKQPGKFVGETGCEKLPVEICGAGCTYEEGPEECHDKVTASLVDVPEEVCDLNPQKTCRFQTRLVPKLAPKHECTIIPQETCNLKFSNPEQVDKPLMTKWCLDPAAPTPGETYEEGPDVPPPVTRPPFVPPPQNDQDTLPVPQDLPGYGQPQAPPPPPPTQPPTLYSASDIRSARQDAFFNGNSVSSFVPAPVAPTTQQRRQGRNNGGGRRRNRNGRRRNGGRRRSGRQFQQ